MTLLAQHGWGKSDKIDTGFGDGSINGLVVSPRDETPDNAADLIAKIADEQSGSVRFFDPQFHAGMVTPANDGKLPEYDYYLPNLTRRDFIGAAKIASYAADTLDYQYELQVSGLLSPTIEIVNFSDSSGQIALQLADASLTHHAGSGDDRPLLLSFLISETALADRDDLDAFLDAVTIMGADGFYLMFSRTASSHNAMIESERLAGMMYMAYILRVVNDLDVYCGYSDLVSLPLHAAGATGTACGWSGTLRRFTFNRFKPSKGGRAARPRYLSMPVLESILISELDQVYESDLVDEFRSDTDYDGDFSTIPPYSVSWPPREAALHHWQALSARIAAIESLTVDAATSKLFDWIDSAETLRIEAERRGVEFEPPSGRHLEQWRLGINQFREMVEIA